jgi:tetratricopeptide (TPR) repeat protein
MYAGLLKRDPKNEIWRVLLGDIFVRLGTLQEPVHDSNASEQQTQRGISVLKELASRNDAQVLDLELAARALVTVQPAHLRDPELAAKFAERGLALDNRQNPQILYTLAIACRLAGQPEKARETAREALALLPASDFSRPSRIRRRLEAEAIMASQSSASSHYVPANAQ